MRAHKEERATQNYAERLDSRARGNAEYHRFRVVSPRPGKTCLREGALTHMKVQRGCIIVDIMQTVIIVDKWHPLLGGVYGNLKH